MISFKTQLMIFILVCILGAGGIAMSDNSYPVWDTYSDTWVATDDLERTVPGFTEVGQQRSDRFVGAFYFLWMGAHVNGGPWDNSKILAQDPDAINNTDSPLWGPMHAMHHWGEPLFDYYTSDDEYVLRKHAQMLADAGVDVIIFDVTNQITYKQYYMALLKVFTEVREAGGRTPQVAFLCPFGDPGKVVNELWNDLYGQGLYKDLWFQWKGKPLILADPGMVAKNRNAYNGDIAIRLGEGQILGQTFTATKPFVTVGARVPTWETSDSSVTFSLYRENLKGELITSQRFKNIADNAWVQISVENPLPAGKYYLEMSDPDGSVGWWCTGADVQPASEPIIDGAVTTGDRSLYIGYEDDESRKILNFFTFRKPQASYFQGPTGPDQWSWLEIYPQHVFMNSEGKKEQMSVGIGQNAVDNRIGSMSEPNAKGRSFRGNGGRVIGPDAVRYGYNVMEQWERALQEDPEFIFITGWNEWIAMRFTEFAGVKMPVAFVDQFDQEHSRDIEPMKGGHGDDYYYQMASYIRKFKGVREPQKASAPQTINLENDFSQWAGVMPEFRDDINDEARRDHMGYNDYAHLVNNTGRNDFVAMRVARDSENIYFYTRTREAITPYTNPQWMQLFIDIDCDHKTGWEGYDFVVNRTVKDDKTTVLEINTGGWNWQAVGDVQYRVNGREKMLAIPCTMLKLDTTQSFQFDFKWADNTGCEGDINAFTLNGDVAPTGRFNFRYQVTTESLLAVAPVTHPFLGCDLVQGKVFVVNAEGQIEWSLDVPGCQDVWVLPDGNFLLSNVRGVQEVTRDKQVVWEYISPEGTEVHACQPLADGNVMVCECGTKRIVEVNRQGEIVKEVLLDPVTTNVHAHFRIARKLANGNYLVALVGDHMVKEYDSEGRVLRTINAPGDPFIGLRLPDGNTLIACGDGHKLIEVDPQNNIVWQINEYDLPGIPLRFVAGLQRLPNGNTVVCNWGGHGHIDEQPQIFEVTPDKQVVWQIADYPSFQAFSNIQLLDVPGDVTKGEILR